MKTTYHPVQEARNLSRTQFPSGVHGIKRAALAISVALLTALTAQAASLLDFNTNMPSGLNFGVIPASYQPVPGLVIGYSGVGLFNGGPDHTRGVTGGTNYNTYQRSSAPQVFTFNKPVSLPSVWLTTFSGSGDVVFINVFADEFASSFLGTVSFNTTAHSGQGTYAWSECTGLDDPAFNGQIRRLEVSSDSNAQIDDMSIVVNTSYGTLQDISMTVPTQSLFVGMSRQATTLANYEFFSGIDVTRESGVAYTSSATGVATVSTNGVIEAVGEGNATITATLQDKTSVLEISVSPVAGPVVDFNAGLTNLGAQVQIPSTYQPIPGLTIGYVNVGVFNGGPDNTTGVTGGNRYCTYQFSWNVGPQAYTFNKPVSIPSMWLTAFNGGGDPITISVYADTEGSSLLGTLIFSPSPHGGAGLYTWSQCTSLDDVAYNGLIRRIELSAGAPNANLDDMVVVVSTNTGALLSIDLTLPLADLYQGMSRPATVTADYEFLSDSDVTLEGGVQYSSSNLGVATVTTNGLVQAVGPGTATITATLGTKNDTVQVTVTGVSGTVLDFNKGLEDVGNYVPIPGSYQPVPGLIIGYTNVGLFSGGPDNTTGVTGGNRYNAYQSVDGTPQIYTFSQPISVPSFWAATYYGSGDPLSISAYSDTEGVNLLGTVSASTVAFAGPGDYAWTRCTELDSPTYNGQIRRLEVSGAGVNANVDDLVIVSQSPVALTAQLSGNSMVLTWPNSGGGTLMASPVLGPGASWVAVAQMPTLVGTNYQVSLPVSETNAFFRLEY